MAIIPNGMVYQGGERPSPRWKFVMLNPEQMRFVVQATNRLQKPHITLRVWNIALTYVKRNTGEITATYQQLAEDAATSYGEVSRAMGELTRLGALIREKQGGRITYYVNPQVGWNGEEGTRREAAHKAPKLQTG